MKKKKTLIRMPWTIDSNYFETDELGWIYQTCLYFNDIVEKQISTKPTTYLYYIHSLLLGYIEWAKAIAEDRCIHNIRA